jgi:hypothetical protein
MPYILYLNLESANMIAPGTINRQIHQVKTQLYNQQQPASKASTKQRNENPTSCNEFKKVQ